VTKTEPYFIDTIAKTGSTSATFGSLTSVASNGKTTFTDYVTDYEIRVKHKDTAYCGLQLTTVTESDSEIKSMSGTAIGGTVTTGTGAQQFSGSFNSPSGAKVYLVPVP
jgi:hypothetical protein